MATSTKVFVPRTLAPLADESWYNTSKNKCISRMNGTVLPNCFVGSTQIITSMGVFTLKKSYDYCRQNHTIEVPTVDGEWHKATVKYFGKQEIYRLELEASTYYCSANHRWFIQSKKGLRVVPTWDLHPGMKIPYRMCNTEPFTRVVSVSCMNKEEGVYCVVEPITRSFTLSGGEITGNCVGYAYGRFSEILGYFHPDLPKCNAGDWLDTLKKNKNTTLTWGNEPRLGAVAVWKNPGKAGHVAVVEAINDDGSIMLSESGYNHSWNQRFWNSGPKKGPNWYGAPYEFQGFIYNPATEDVTLTVPYNSNLTYGTSISVNSERYSGPWTDSTSGVSEVYHDSYSSAPEHPARQFVKAAMQYAGSEAGHKWVQSLTKIAINQNWTVAMCCAAAIECGYENKVIPKSTFYPTAFASELVQQYKGKAFTGGARNGTQKPQTGDIFGILNYKSTSKFAASSVGIVRELQGDTILAAEGNINGKIVLSRRRLKDIVWFIRPDWTKVGGTEECTSLMANPLYATASTRADATLREVAFLNDQCEPSINMTNTKLSAINYTSVLSGVYDLLGGSSYVQNSYSFQGQGLQSGNYTVDGSGLKPTNAKIIFEFLVSKGLSAAQAIGILANIQAESGFSTSAVNSSTGASGICQWLGSRKTELINRLGSDWSNDLSGQMDFLWYELNGSESSTLKKLQEEVIGNDQSAALLATDIFLKSFERPGHYDVNTPKRQAMAKILWSMILVTEADTGQISTSGVGNQITTQSGKSLTSGETIIIPYSDSLNVVSATYTDYTKQFSSWKRNTNQGKLADIWAKQGRESKYYISTISGYFLVSVPQEIGEPGDILSVVLDDGTYFNCIVADNHTISLSTLKFETNGSLATYLQAGLQQAGWLKKKAIKAINYGTWLD